MLRSTDTCQNKVSADQYHVTISRAQVYNSLRSRVFPKLTADQMIVFDWIAGSTSPTFVPSLSAFGDFSGAPAAEGRQAEPHTHIRELKGTHELIFSCVPWLAVLLVGAYARRRRRRRWSRATWRPYSNNRLTEPWFTVYFFDIGHPCYDQLTPVKIRYLLTSIM